MENKAQNNWYFRSLFIKSFPWIFVPVFQWTILFSLKTIYYNLMKS